MPGGTVSGTSKPKPKITLKVALALVALLLFAGVAAVGVLISQRQRQVSGPVAPSAPTSRPSAAEMTSQSCRLEFVINAPTGSATCESKEAVLTPGGAASEQPLNLPSGSEFFYKVKFSSTHQTSGGVMFRDELPAQLEFVQDSANTPGLQVNGQVITKSYAQLNPGQNETIVFKVRIKENSPIDKITNTAVITTEGVTPVTSQCTEDILVAASGKAQCTAKEAFRLKSDGTIGEQIAANGQIQPGEEFVYRLKLSAAQETAGSVTITDELPANVSFVRKLQSTPADISVERDDKTITAKVGVMEDNSTAQLDLVVKLSKEAQAGNFTNNAVVVTGGLDDTKSTCSIRLDVPSPTPTPTPTPTPGTSPTPTPTKPPATPTPTPAPGCNDKCTTNADCSNSDHICYTVGDQGVCRLPENVDSITCTMPAPDQPELPPELPTSGPEDWGTWLKMGLVTLGLGAVLLLLL